MPPAGPQTLPLAWALKDLCYAAWSSEPPRAARAAEVLRQLLDAGVDADQADPLLALVEWAAGIARLTQGQMQQAVHCFDAAAAAFRRAGLADPAAQTQVPKIMALTLLGQHAQAARCAETTQAELRALGNLAAAGRVSLNLGGMHLHQDAYAQAAQHYREAAVLFARIGDRDHSVTADIGLADTQAAKGDFDEALLTYARARMRCSQHGLELSQALIDESVALVDLARGSYRDALAGLERARRRYQTLAMPQYLAIAEKQLADIYLELHLLPEALALFNAAVAQFAALDLPDEQAFALAQQGRTLARLGQTDAASGAFNQAASLFERQANPVGVATVALARAQLLLLAQARGPQALTLAQQAAASFAVAGHADGLARAAVVRAEALLLAGERAQARRLFDATLAGALQLQQIQIQVRCLTGLGRVALAEGDLFAASADFEAAIELFEDQRRALPGDDIRSAFLGDHLRPYTELLRLALGSGEAAAVLTQLERYRARALDERLAERLDQASGPSADLQRAAAADPPADDTGPLRMRLNWLYRRLQRLHEEGGDSAALGAELLQTERALLERARRGRLTGAAPQAGWPVVPAPGDGAAGRSAARDAGVGASEASPGFDPVALQAALGVEDALVEYGVVDDELFACVVTRQGVWLRRRLAPWSEVVKAVAAARFQIETLNTGSAVVQQHMALLTQRATRRLCQLHDLIWAPCAPILQACRRVIVVPHAQLGSVPFAALQDDLTPVGHRWALAMAPSARVALRGFKRLPGPPHRVLALGDSLALAHAGAEARAVAAHFSQGQALVDEQANLDQMRQLVGQADVLHLACHAQFRGDNPQFSALHLRDGALTVEQTEGLTLRACTVVLSACETGLAGQCTGDEMVGLVRAFLVAGAARVVASLWPVDDRVTALFMAHFYPALRQGQSSAEALRTARMALRATHPHPGFWGAFTLFGGW